MCFVCVCVFACDVLCACVYVCVCACVWECVCVVYVGTVQNLPKGGSHFKDM